ncbi:uncharacterized protein LOC123410913 [Hordeum vulgare subsp. vulgare]|uniref:uncharacterized protein LOC123406922 n=1 Tax=Hordeum vulgare subsp. vulgare TaxID=112509 RepID=UPI000B465332|nr:uncharacterized protein LOC123406922 [Hordeum vulgare subsp. vulgare]XP_044959775.1 uncharacterized protein LOC123410913 [Hordeum vulgare subsp. vulgare]
MPLTHIAFPDAANGKEGQLPPPPAPDDAATAGRSTRFPAVGDTGHLTSSSIAGDLLGFLGQIHAACKPHEPLGELSHTLSIVASI